MRGIVAAQHNAACGRAVQFRASTSAPAKLRRRPPNMSFV
jgi:hypothetical protein